MSILDELITKNGWEFLIDQNKKPFLKASNGKKVEYIPIASDSVKSLILKDIYEDRGVLPSRAERDQMHDAMTAKALFSKQIKDIRIRTAVSEKGLEIDLNNEEGECIYITSEGWGVGQPTAAFYRPSSLRQMATPKSGATWDIFKKHFKTKSDEDLMLIIGFMLSCFRPQGPYPILVLQGEQGSAKSTTANMIKRIVDHSLGQTRGLIKKEQDLFIAAQNNHLLSFDNVSGIHNDLSDALCRIAILLENKSSSSLSRRICTASSGSIFQCVLVSNSEKKSRNFSMWSLFIAAPLSLLKSLSLFSTFDFLKI